MGTGTISSGTGIGSGTGAGRFPTCDTIFARLNTTLPESYHQNVF